MRRETCSRSCGASLARHQIAPAIGRHAEAAMGEAAVDRTPDLTLTCAQRHEEGQDMLVARMSLHALGLETPVFDQAGNILRCNPICQPIVEAGGPGRRLFAIDAELAQIMDRSAVGED